MSINVFFSKGHLFVQVDLLLPLRFETIINGIHLTGGMILAADYSQLELRVLAHLSKDQRLLQVCVSSTSRQVDRCVKTFETKAIISPGVKRGGRCVPMHCCRVEKY